MPPLTLLIKPASSLCNMRCRYCFYADVSDRRAVKSYGVMDGETARAVVRRAFQYADGAVTFGFQGGEPTLAGLDYFQNFVALVREYNTRGLAVHYALQTNGYALDEAFAAFLAQHGFLVGLSMDGPQALHDSLRPGADGAGSYARVQGAAHLLEQYKVAFNILCVVSGPVARAPKAVFRALAPYGFLQFIPCLDDFGGAGADYSLTPEDYAGFLKGCFDEYERAFYAGKYVSIRLFDNYVGMLCGRPPEACDMRGECGGYLLVESDGGVYPCDFYVLDEWRMGNLKEQSLPRLMKSPVLARFLQEGRSHEAACRDCRWRVLCRGGCRRHREQERGALGPNRFCESYREFFAYAYPRMARMARNLPRG